jgi:hypothetical protein
MSAAISSISWSHSSRIVGSRLAARFGVNALPSAERSLVWSGGSQPISVPSGATTPAIASRTSGSVDIGSTPLDEKLTGSRKTASMSS